MAGAPSSGAEPLRFRKQALEPLSSPEQLERQLQVVGPTGWGIVATLVFALVVALVWGFLGSIPTHVSGQGILRYQGGGVRQVVARGDGQLQSIEVTVGQGVKMGDVIARLENPDLRQRVADATQQVDTLREDRARMVEYFDSYMQEEKRYFAQIRENTLSLIRGADQQIAANKKIVDALESLLRQHYTTSVQVEEAREKLFQIQSMRDQNTQKLTQLAIEQLEQVRDRTQQLESYDLQIVQAEGTLREAEVQLKQSEELRSPISGRIAEILAEEDAVVSDGTPIVLVQYGDPVLDAVIYVSAGEGKKIQPGMQANIAPLTVKKEEYGTLDAKVTDVALYPTTKADMLRILNDETLVESFLQQGPPLAIIARLEKDPKAPSGYRWSSGKGPRVVLTGGTLASATVTVEERPPIALVIPALRRFIGIYP